MLSKRFLILFFVLTGVFPAMSRAQDIVFAAQASAHKVGLKDQFQLSFIIKNAGNVSNFIHPSFSGFEVLDGPNQSSHQYLTIINGRRQIHSSVQLSYVLQPKQKGQLTIPGATAVIDGQKYTSNPVRINVVPGSIVKKQRQSNPFGSGSAAQQMQRQMQQMQQFAQRMQQQMQQQMGMNPPSQSSVPNQNLRGLDEKNLKNNVFIRVTVDNTHPYVGQQITASYKLYTRLPMNMQLTQLPSLNGFWSEDFDIPNPPKPSIETIKGKKYQVFLLKKSALFPQHDGKLTLDPAKAKGIVRVIEKSKQKSPLANDPGFGSLFMNDPFFNNGYFSRYHYKDVATDLASQPVSINVRPLPVAGQPKDFSGAVGHFTISAAIDSSTLYTGNTANFVLTIKGSGNFKLIGNPKIDFPPSLSPLDPLVADTITSRSPTISGQKTFTYNLSPQQAGKFTIPAIRFSYFDPKTHSYQTLHTKPIDITVKKGASNVADNSVATVLAHDIHPNITNRQNWQTASLLFVVTPWYWALYLIGLIIFIVALYLNNRKNDRAANVALWKNKKANKVAWKRLSTARKLLPKKEAHNAFYEEVSKAIWLYLSDKLNIPISELSKDNIAEKLRQKGIQENDIQKTYEILSECELALYSPSGGQKQRNNTLDAVSGLIGDLENVLHKKRKSIAHAEL